MDNPTEFTPSSSPSEKIAGLIENLDHLPTLPIVVTQIMNILSDPKSSAFDLTQIVAQDQALTARILKMVNSAYYGFARKISTVNHAIVILGFETIRDLALGASVFDIFFTDDKGAEGFNRQDLWKHSIGCGLAAKVLAREFKYSLVGQAYVAGLLHDIGIIVLDQYCHEEFMEAIKMSKQTSRPLHETEKEILNTNHHKIGRLIAKKWGFPVELEETITYHHMPVLAKNHPLLASTVHLGKQLCKRLEIGFDGDYSPADIDPEAWKVLCAAKPGLKEEDLDDFSEKIKTVFPQSEAFALLNSIEDA
jgi:putative nucleotidyltransferase with HDIG domain